MSGWRTEVEVDIAFRLAASFLHARALAGHASVGRPAGGRPASILGGGRAALIHCFAAAALFVSWLRHSIHPFRGSR